MRVASGRRTNNGDKRKFVVRYRGHFWEDEEQSAEHVTDELIAEYDERKKRQQKKQRFVVLIRALFEICSILISILGWKRATSWRI